MNGLVKNPGSKDPALICPEKNGPRFKVQSTRQKQVNRIYDLLVPYALGLMP
jgi:hypothetical protein